MACFNLLVLLLNYGLKKNFKISLLLSKNTR